MRPRTRSTAATATTLFRAASARTSCSARRARTSSSSPSIAAANADKIKDFEHGQDKIFLDQDIFAAVGPKVGKKEYFEGKKAHDKNDHIIKNGNKLFYDDDGKGGDKQVLFAKVDKHAVLDHHDFTVGDFVI